MKTDQNNNLQYALFQAAKVGNIKLMREFIEAGADPFEVDSKNLTALQYARQADPIKASSLLLDLLIELQANSKLTSQHNTQAYTLIDSSIPYQIDSIDNFKKRGSNV